MKKLKLEVELIVSLGSSKYIIKNLEEGIILTVLAVRSDLQKVCFSVEEDGEEQTYTASIESLLFASVDITKEWQKAKQIEKSTKELKKQIRDDGGFSDSEAERIISFCLRFGLEDIDEYKKYQVPDGK